MSKIGLTNYELNQQAYRNLPSLDEENLLIMLDNIKNNLVSQTYYMLLCRERNDYTIFNLKNNNFDTAIQEIREVLESRGEILDINYVNKENCYQCWVRERRTESIDELEHELNYKWMPQVWMFMLFDADDFVIEIGD